MVRLQKYLADAGVASRRAGEEIILAGRVTVNGETVRQLGTKVDPDRDKVAVDRALDLRQPPRPHQHPDDGARRQPRPRAIP